MLRLKLQYFGHLIRRTDSLEKSNGKPRQHIKKQRHYFANKVLCSQSYGFSSGHIQMWELDHEEGWVLKNSDFWTIVLEKILESPLNSKEIKPVNPKRNQPWMFIGRTDAGAKATILWLLGLFLFLYFKFLLLGFKITNKKWAFQTLPLTPIKTGSQAHSPFVHMMLKLKLQYFGHLMQRIDSLEKILLLGR